MKATAWERRGVVPQVLLILCLICHCCLALPMPIHRMKKWAEAGNAEQLFEDLEKIAVVRVPDTPGHATVLDWIEKSFPAEWQIERDSFQAPTPYGNKMFTNVIATLNPGASRRLVVAAHVDSKYFEPPINYVGATDSATCCAILLNLGRVFAKAIPANADTTLQLIFFDGEEAFVEWGPTDSLYGSRHLAERWEEEGKLAGIELFILLDLVGGKNAAFYSLYEDTESHFGRLQAIETQLQRSKSLALGGKLKGLFKGAAHHIKGLQDDHVPFLARGVPILHLISLPFPAVWHTPNDDVENVDRSVFTDFDKVLRVFVAEYFSLAVPK